MFVDHIVIKASSGKGGAGCASFHREKFVIKGGPDGGDGGNGGDVYVIADKNTHTLSHFKGKRHIKAKNGQPGKSRNMHGKRGEDAYIIVPPGTQVFDNESGELLVDMLEDGQKTKLLEGGKGGLGNTHFKSATNQRPTYAQPGLAGVEKELRLELKLIADVGLVGFPNVGKSTLISTISNAKPQVANYEFTTLTPKLGVVQVDEYSSFVMADIPGIIEKASQGKGLGIEFLKHIERTKTLLYMIDLANYRDPVVQFKTLQKELKNYSQTLSQRKFAIALTKADASIEEIVNDFFERLGITPTNSTKYGLDTTLANYFGSNPEFIIPISALTNYNIEPLKWALFDIVKNSEDASV
ncbi:MAG: GTPase ObgE [Epsilonproteobacteria bacterium]|nr:GTPase ObgE [Campylobacterota bacterium]